MSRATPSQAATVTPQPNFFSEHNCPDKRTQKDSPAEVTPNAARINGKKKVDYLPRDLFELQRADRLLLDVLRELARDDAGQTTPPVPIPLLSKLAGISQRQVQRSGDRLESLNCIARVGRVNSLRRFGSLGMRYRVTEVADNIPPFKTPEAVIAERNQKIRAFIKKLNEATKGKTAVSRS